MARKFFYVCAGMLMLALSYHFGASSATAQAPGNPVVAMYGTDVVITANGDLYQGTNFSGSVPLNWAWRVNIFGGGPVPTQRESWGQLKSRYAPNRGTARPGTSSR